MPLFKNKWEVPDELITQLRSRFFDELRSDENLYHPDDIERVKDNDWFIGRYLLHMEKDVEKAFNMLTESLKYRKEYEINTLRKKDLPKEYFDARAIFIYNKDKRDHPVVVVRCKTHVKKEETRRQQLQYMLYWIEKAVRSADWGAVSVLFDCTDSGVGNVDLDMMRHLFETFKKYYPWCLSYFMVYNMPWYLSAVWRIIKQWIPQRHVSKITFVDANGLRDFIPEDQLPVCMGGTSTKMYEPKEGFKDGDESE
ncbi:motile sperm domain-containing protein 2-like [Argiope bruennichi]|uniref:Motile sperm domain-containing protein 2 n=1 Tax=Argiope bruennichi TaxID=94029 RepID=A0A8T0E1P6_ARGBR|nr:motile sperm domain-containing protein 2-like [Argiope bruennichi]KAF8764047.1 Motile sperm domain-containing protein 2 [Argiope bruennichi]